MTFSQAAKKLFLRGLYEAGSTPAARKAILDQLSAQALKTLSSGKLLTRSQGEGYDVEFEAFKDYDPNQLVNLCDWAYGWIGYDTIDDALEGFITPPVTQYRTSVRSLRYAT